MSTCPAADLLAETPDSFRRSGRVLTPSKEPGNERNGNEAAHGHSFRSYLKIRVFGSMQNPGPRQSNQYERYVLRKPRQIGAHINLRWCRGVHLHQIISYCSRSVGPFGPPKQKKRVQHFFFLFLDIYTVFSRAAPNLFVSHNQSAPIHAAK